MLRWNGELNVEVRNANVWINIISTRIIIQGNLLDKQKCIVMITELAQIRMNIKLMQFWYFSQTSTFMTFVLLALKHTIAGLNGNVLIFFSTKQLLAGQHGVQFLPHFRSFPCFTNRLTPAICFSTFVENFINYSHNDSLNELCCWFYWFLLLLLFLILGRSIPHMYNMLSLRASSLRKIFVIL